jgi:hypothetical protein
VEVWLRCFCLPLLWVCLTTAACSPDLQVAAGKDGEGPGPTDAVQLDTDVPAAGDLVALDLDSTATATCLGVTCSGHGTCVADDQGLRCACDPGFVPGDQLKCVDATFCPQGQVRAAGQCVPQGSLTKWCDNYCGSLALACPQGQTQPAACQPYCSHADEQGPDCVASCLGRLDQPGQVQRVICGGLMRRFDSARCQELAQCESPPDPAPVSNCEAICTAADGCGLLLDARFLLGSNLGECRLYCQALRTALGPFNRADLVEQCLLQAMTSCDPVYMLGCTVAGLPELAGRLCTTAASDCGYIPDVWADQATCSNSLQSWTAGQQIAVGGCLEIGGNYTKCKENGCATPPDELPPGALQAVKAMMAHCPHLIATPLTYPFADEFYAWMWVTILRAFGLPIDRDYSLISDCYLNKPCPATKPGNLQCLLSTPKE